MSISEDKSVIKLSKKLFQNPFRVEDDQFNGLNDINIFDGVNNIFDGTSSGSIVFERFRSYDGSISSSSTSPCSTSENMEQGDNKITLFGQKSINNLMLFSLLEHLCTLYVDDDQDGSKLFVLLCEKLHCMKLIQNFGTLDDLKAIRQKYQAAFVNLMSAALESLKNSGDINSLHPEKLLQVATKKHVTPLTLHSWYKDMFEEGKLIAFGGFGEVVEAKNKLDQKCYAIKKVKLQESQLEICRKTLREVQVFSDLNHSNIVRYHSSWLEYGFNDFRGSNEDDCASTNEIKTVSKVGELFSLHLNDSHFGNFNVGLLKNKQSSQKYISYEKDIDDCDDCDDCDDGDVEQFNDDVFSIDSESPPKDDKKTCRKRNSSLGRSFSSGDVPFPHGQMEEVIYCRGKFYDGNLRSVLNMTLFIQMELCQMTLQSWIHDRNLKLKVYSDVNRLINIKIFKQITLAIKYIHNKGLIHRDVKPSNIFINILEGNNIIIKVGDFGLARNDNLPKTPTSIHSSLDIPLAYMSSQPNHVRHTKGIGTAVYAAPEQKLTCNYSNKADIFSMGIILFELFCVFHTEMERLDSIKDLLGVPTCGDIEEILIEECKLILEMTLKDPDKRPSADAILNVAFIAGDNTKKLDQFKKKVLQQEVEITRLKNLLKETELKLCSQCQLLCTHKKD